MARIVYKGKKKDMQVHLPSETIVVNPGDSFEVTGKDYLHMRKVMDISLQQGEGYENQSFALADDVELHDLERGIDYTPPKVNRVTAPKDTPKVLPKEGEEEDLRKLNYPQLRSRCKKADIEIPNGAKKPDLIRLYQEHLDDKKAAEQAEGEEDGMQEGQ